MSNSSISKRLESLRLSRRSGAMHTREPASPEGSGRGPSDEAPLLLNQDERTTVPDRNGVRALLFDAGDKSEARHQGRAQRRARRDERLKRQAEKDEAASPTVINLPPLPSPIRKRSRGLIASFILCVLLPTLAAGTYAFAIASDQYAVDFKFSVRNNSVSSNATASSTTAVASFLGMQTPDAPDNYVVVEFLTSRQAVEELEQRFNLRQMFSGDSIDWLARFDATKPIEQFMPYWRRMVSASYDAITNIGVVQIRAFSPQDTHKIATALLGLSEELVNKIARRPLQDAIHFAEGDVTRAENRLKSVREALSQFRTTEQVIDPNAGIVTSNVLLAQTLRSNLSQMETDLATLTKQKLGANAAVVDVLQTRIKATREQLAATESQVRKAQSGNSPIAQVVARFEQLDLERQFAQAMLQTAVQNLEQARSNALAQHIYVTAFVEPSMPQSSTYPKRILLTLATAFFALLLWTITILVVRSIREHLT